MDRSALKKKEENGFVQLSRSPTAIVDARTPAARKPPLKADMFVVFKLSEAVVAVVLRLKPVMQLR